MNQSQLDVITCRWNEAGENVYERVMIGFGFTSDWMKKEVRGFKVNRVA